MPTFPPFSFFPPTTSSTSASQTPCPPQYQPPHRTAYSTSGSALSRQHRNNGYEDLTLHLTQGYNQARERSRSREVWGRRSVIGGWARGRRGTVRIDEAREGGERSESRASIKVIEEFVRERREGAVQEERSLEEVSDEGTMKEGEDIPSLGADIVKAAERRVERMIEGLPEVDRRPARVSSCPKTLDDEDEISDLDLDLDGCVALMQQGIRQELKIVEKGSIKVVGVGGDGHGNGRGWRLRRHRDYCTPPERRRIEEWIAACERAKCKGFVKRFRGRNEGDERGSNTGEAQAEEEVNVRGGGGKPGWPEWGLDWGASRFMK